MDKLRKTGKAKENEVPLDAVRLLIHQHRIKLEPGIHQVKDLPTDYQLEYYFVPMQYMSQYASYYRPGKPFKNIKLINYNRPAISLSFFCRHKYVVQRDPKPDEVQLHLQNHRDELLDLSLIHELTVDQKADLHQTNELLHLVRENPRVLKACFSNYHHHYQYWYCTYRYFEDAELTLTDSSNEHLLKHTERIKGQVNERLNVIFIDPHSITQHVPNDNKFVDRELAGYPIQIRQGITTLYLQHQDDNRT